MSCRGCGSHPKPPKPVKTGVRELSSTRATTVVNHLGQVVAVDQSLIRRPGKPVGGWNFAVNVGGQNITVSGGTAQECYMKVVEVMSANNIPWNKRDLWLSLNLYWLPRTNEKYHIVRMRDLSIVADKPSDLPPQEPGQRLYPPKVWGRLGWGWLSMWLARDSYRYDEFVRECRNVLELLDPYKNPSIGCRECYTEFGMEVKTMEGSPPDGIDQARRWLFEVHNRANIRVGKKPLTWEQAAKECYWV